MNPKTIIRGIEEKEILLLKKEQQDFLDRSMKNFEKTLHAMGVPLYFKNLLMTVVRKLILDSFQIN